MYFKREDDNEGWSSDFKKSKPVKSNNGEKLKKYTCRVCKEKYFMTSKEYGSRSMTAKKRTCDKVDCLYQSAMDYLNRQKEREKKKEREKWKVTKEQFQKDLRTKKSQKVDPLLNAVNKIARLLDKDLPCLARPFNRDNNYDGGHVIPRSRYPSLKYHLWNIHKQGRNSNKSQKDDDLMLDGLRIRYGKERMDFVKNLHLKYPTLKHLTKEDLREALSRANEIIRRLEKGEKMERDYVNEFIGIYKEG